MWMKVKVGLDLFFLAAVSIVLMRSTWSTYSIYFLLLSSSESQAIFMAVNCSIFTKVESTMCAAASRLCCSSDGGRTK